jgi:hypothetical protein
MKYGTVQDTNRMDLRTFKVYLWGKRGPLQPVAIDMQVMSSVFNFCPK